MTPPRVAVTADPLDAAALAAAASDRNGHDGAVLTFVGTVRDRSQGRRVRFLAYEAYEPLALRALERIVSEVDETWPTATMLIHHRIGRLELGEASIVIAVATPHRADAFAACRYAIERVKQIVPIWKREHFDDGDVWVEGQAVHPDDASARAAAHRIACT